jgi:phosphatidylserine/phosphatidylglycerophosphate/cardiolipin synthase-like enzyme
MRTAAGTGTHVTLLYSHLTRTLPEQHRDAAVAELQQLGIELRYVKDLHAKFLVWDDDTLVVSSFNWLATTPDPWKPVGAEVGLLIRGKGIGLQFANKIAAELAALETITTGLPSREGAPS